MQSTAFFTKKQMRAAAEFWTEALELETVEERRRSKNGSSIRSGVSYRGKTYWDSKEFLRSKDLGGDALDWAVELLAEREEDDGNNFSDFDLKMLSEAIDFFTGEGWIRTHKAMCYLAIACGHGQLKEEPQGEGQPSEPLPLWKASKQDVWWYMMCMNVSGDYRGCPQEKIDALHQFLRLDPEAPREYQPYAIVHTGGHRDPLPAYYDQIGQHNDAGMRPVHVVGDREIKPKLELARMREQLDHMRNLGALPYAVSIGNEPEFGERISAQDYSEICRELVDGLDAIAKEYGVKVAMPCLSSIDHATGAYAKGMKPLCEGKDWYILLVDSYGHAQPKNYVLGNAKQKMIDASGISEVIIKESGDAFHGHEGGVVNARVVDANAGEFREKMCYSSVQTQIPTCPFLWHHLDPFEKHYDDISHPEHGRTRRDAITRVRDDIQRTGEVGDVTLLELSDPRGKELDPKDYQDVGPPERSGK